MARFGRLRAVKRAALLLFAALASALAARAADTHTVTFRRLNGTVFQTVEVAHGAAVAAPDAPAEAGFSFTAWDHADRLTRVTNNVTCWALYEKKGYLRIYTNTKADNTVAYEAPPVSTKLSGPVKATVWRGWNMNYGRPASFANTINKGYEVGYFIRTALGQYFERENADIVVFLTKNPAWQLAYATANASASAAVPEPLMVPRKNRQESHPIAPQALQATVQFNEAK